MITASIMKELKAMMELPIKKFLGYNRLLTALFADISVTLKKKIKNFENEKLGLIFLKVFN